MHAQDDAGESSAKAARAPSVKIELDVRGPDEIIDWIPPDVGKVSG